MEIYKFALIVQYYLQTCLQLFRSVFFLGGGGHLTRLNYILLNGFYIYLDVTARSIQPHVRFLPEGLYIIAFSATASTPTWLYRSI